MLEVITEAQKVEIEKLAVCHYDALVAYGADMYKRGIIKGAICAIAGYASFKAIKLSVKAIKLHKKHTT